MLEMPFDNDFTFDGRDSQPIEIVVEPPPIETPISNDTPAETGWSPNVLPPATAATVEPVDHWPVPSFQSPPAEPVVYEPPPIVSIVSPPSNETMYEPYKDNCQCVAYPCDCDGSGRIDPLPMPFDTIKPTPIIDPWTSPYEPVKGSPIVNPTPMPFEPVKTTGGRIDPLPYATQPPPIVTTLNINGGTAGDGKAADASASEPMKILGLPWYYVAGAATVLLLLSSSDGKK